MKIDLRCAANDDIRNHAPHDNEEQPEKDEVVHLDPPSLSGEIRASSANNSLKEFSGNTVFQKEKNILT